VARPITAALDSGFACKTRVPRNDGAAHTFTGAMMPAGKISSGLARRWAMPC
jgi:hypothetical protein